MRHIWKLFVFALCVLVAAALPANATIVTTFFPASTFNSNTAAMDTALGITGDSIDTFEAAPLLPGLTVTLSNGVPTTTWTSLPNLFDQGVCGTLSVAAWDGTHAAINSPNNLLNSCSSPTGLARMITFNYAPGTTSFGISLSNFQSTNPPSPSFPITNHELFVNGADLGTVESLAGSNWSPGIVRNAYLRVDASGGSSITSVGFENLTADDFLGFDHLAVAAVSTVPEPELVWPMAFAVLPLALSMWRRRIRR